MNLSELEALVEQAKTYSANQIYIFSGFTVEGIAILKDLKEAHLVFVREHQPKDHSQSDNHPADQHPLAPAPDRNSP